MLQESSWLGTNYSFFSKIEQPRKHNISYESMFWFCGAFFWFLIFFPYFWFGLIWFGLRFFWFVFGRIFVFLFFNRKQNYKPYVQQKWSYSKFSQGENFFCQEMILTIVWFFLCLVYVRFTCSINCTFIVLIKGFEGYLGQMMVLSFKNFWVLVGVLQRVLQHVLQHVLWKFSSRRLPVP